MNRVEEIWARRTTRAYVRDGRVTEHDMKSFFEAAIRAPSSYNAQPWRFWYAKANSPQWEKLFALLAGTNAAWAVNADWLVLVGAHQQHEFRGVIGRNPHAAFDTGAACMNFALSATAAGFGCATVGGLNYEKAQELINDDRVAPLAIIVVGSSSLQWGEISPRKDLSMITTTVF